MTEHRTFIVDAFTSSPYCGNPCAVVFGADDLSSDQMQSIARELNLSETVFLLVSRQAQYRMRYFTPTKELPFAGHPTIGAVYAMVRVGLVQVVAPETLIKIETGNGLLPVVVMSSDRASIKIVMAQPAPSYAAVADREGVANSLGVGTQHVLCKPAPQVAGVGVPFLMVGLTSESVLLAIRPVWEALRALCTTVSAQAAYLYAVGDLGAGVDLCARFLDPFAEYEDSFTGSACGAMAALARRGGLTEREHLVVQQGKGVGRIGYAEVDLGQKDGRIRVGGSATLILSGVLESLPRPECDG